jgi:hypothetical protein
MILEDTIFSSKYIYICFYKNAELKRGKWGVEGRFKHWGGGGWMGEIRGREGWRGDRGKECSTYGVKREKKECSTF